MLNHRAFSTQLIACIGKKMLVLYAVLICYISSALSGITKTPGMQRKSLGETATFQWSVTGSLSSYVVNNLQSGTLSANANYTVDSKNTVVTLIIRNIQLSDAGNYSLSMTTGTTTQTDAGALLFVYGYSTVFVNQTSGGSSQLPATEGDTVELTCTVISTSLPEAYRPKMYYKWSLSWIGTLQNISSGPAKIADYGDTVQGYIIKDGDKSLVIVSAQYRDTQGILCYGQEQWSPNQFNSPWFTLKLKYRPYIYSRTPASSKFNAIVGDYVSFLLYFQAFPAVTSAYNWSFIDTAGHIQNLPVGFSYTNSNSRYSLSFTFAAEANYGNYSITLSNDIGSSTETFQVLRPGPPDPPSDVRADFVSHYLIVIAWNCMWFNGREQTVFLQLKALYNDSVIDSSTTISYLDCYNSTYTTPFQNGIQPETDYEVRIWASNNQGSSDVVILKVKTPKIFKFIVSSKTISLNGNQAIVNFRATEGKLARLDVTCCLELTGDCYSFNYYNVNSTAVQINLDSIPTGDEYVFDFMVYGGDPRRNIYYLAMVKGVRVSRNGEVQESGGVKASPLQITVIVLGVLLGVAVLAFIGCLIAFLVSKRRQNRQPSNSQQTHQPRTTTDTRAPQPTTQQNNQAYEEDDTYEAVDGDPSKDDTHYTALEGQRYR